MPLVAIQSSTYRLVKKKVICNLLLWSKVPKIIIFHLLAIFVLQGSLIFWFSFLTTLFIILPFLWFTHVKVVYILMSTYSVCNATWNLPLSRNLLRVLLCATWSCFWCLYIRSWGLLCVIWDWICNRKFFPFTFISSCSLAHLFYVKEFAVDTPNVRWWQSASQISFYLSARQKRTEKNESFTNFWSKQLVANYFFSPVFCFRWRFSGKYRQKSLDFL